MEPKLKSLFKYMIVLLSLVLAGQGFAQTTNDEFRATWVITWEWTSAGTSVEQSKQRICQILDNHVKANMNAVLFQVRQSGTAYYPSSFEPWGSYSPGYTDYDPLAFAVEEAHKRGLELHAWFNAFHTSSTRSGTPVANHPEWICTNQDGQSMTSNYCLSPGLKEVREYTRDVAMELVNNYDLDGIHFDYVRWNEYDEDDMKAENLPTDMNEFGEYKALDGIISPEKLQRLHAKGTKRYIFDVEHPYSGGVPSGFSSWDDWRRWSVTEFVHSVHDSVQQVKPWVKVSVAALGKYKAGGTNGWNGYYVVFQDAGLWFNEGYIDLLTPMHYHWTTASGFYDELRTDWQPYIQQGISAGRIYSVGPGSYQFDSQGVWYNHPAVVAKCRTLSWVDGFHFFSYGTWLKYDYWQEAGETFFAKKVKIKPAQFLSTETPAAPTVQLSSEDSLNYHITVAPPTLSTDNYWMVIYRSEESVIDPEHDPIIDVHFTDSTYTVIDAFDGYQDFSGQYYYAATALNRFWNESEVSNVELGPPVKSFPPTVISSNPVPDDKIVPVEVTITLGFSKTMNTASVESALSIEPAIVINSFQWTSDHKNLSLQTTENLTYNTLYTVALANSAQDINGSPIDGNADGVGGDTFVFTFQTRVADQYLPKVLYSYPTLDGATTTFDAEDIIRIRFNQPIDPYHPVDSSRSKISLLKDGIPQPVDIHINNVTDFSMVNLKTDGPFWSDAAYQIVLHNSIIGEGENQEVTNLVIPFQTSPSQYIEKILIDNYFTSGNWQQPIASDSTYGIDTLETYFDYNTEIYAPASAPTWRHKRAGFLKYRWQNEPLVEGHLIYLEMLPGSPLQTEFDTSYTLQCYIFGDSSNNQLRLVLEENNGSTWQGTEASNWILLDWYGWKLLEWKLSDPAQTGSSSGNGILDGSSYRIGGFQLTDNEISSDSGIIYFDDLRLAKKSSQPVSIENKEIAIPITFTLDQNFPNPFNPSTTIRFTVSRLAKIRLAVFNLKGEVVAELLQCEMEPGSYTVNFDAANLPSGQYLYQLNVDGQKSIRKMLLLK
jgi:uncharacterized lipoprotein YddW (UPF0748 family)